MTTEDAGGLENPVVVSRGGFEMLSLGLGTWTMGEDPARRTREVAALRLGLDLGMTLIDTAELYGGGGAEEVVSEAIRGRRDEVILVSKVLPENASRAGTVEAAVRSLARLGTDRIDLYLLHWPGPHPLEDTLEAFEALVAAGKILHYGVSNFDLAAMQACEALPHGPGVASNQLRYALTRRGLEREILPWCERHDISIMAYSPVEKGGLSIRPALEEVAARHGVTPTCAAIAWSLRHPLVVTVPKSSNPAHVRENARALEVAFTDEDLAALDAAYPRPTPGHFDIFDSPPAAEGGGT